MERTPLKLIHVMDLTVQIGDAVEVGEVSSGTRRLIPILSGQVEGPTFRGRVLPGGADFQIVRRDGVIDVEARYVIELIAGERIYVQNSGFRFTTGSDTYFCTSARFECAAPEYQWLTRYIFIGDGVRYPDRVEIRFFQVDR